MSIGADKSGNVPLSQNSMDESNDIEAFRKEEGINLVRIGTSIC